MINSDVIDVLDADESPVLPRSKSPATFTLRKNSSGYNTLRNSERVLPGEMSSMRNPSVNFVMQPKVTEA